MMLVKSVLSSQPAVKVRDSGDPDPPEFGSVAGAAFENKFLSMRGVEPFCRLGRVSPDFSGSGA